MGIRRPAGRRPARVADTGLGEGGAIAYEPAYEVLGIGDALGTQWTIDDDLVSDLGSTMRAYH